MGGCAHVARSLGSCPRVGPPIACLARIGRQRHPQAARPARPITHATLCGCGCGCARLLACALLTRGDTHTWAPVQAVFCADPFAWTDAGVHCLCCFPATHSAPGAHTQPLPPLHREGRLCKGGHMRSRLNSCCGDRRSRHATSRPVGSVVWPLPQTVHRCRGHLLPYRGGAYPIETEPLWRTRPTQTTHSVPNFSPYTHICQKITFLRAQRHFCR